jgi:hypothetical protein
MRWPKKDRYFLLLMGIVGIIILLSLWIIFFSKTQ